jgi:hypothetical protein
VGAHLQAALQKDAQLEHALPQRVLVAHSQPFGALARAAVRIALQRTRILGPYRLKLPL